MIIFALQDNPVEWVKELEKEKIEAYSGVTQLNLVKPKLKNDKEIETHADCPSDKGLSHAHKISSPTDSTNCPDFGHIKHNNIDLYPHKAKFLIDHVLYLPVHKRVPLKDLAYLCQGVLKVAQRRNSGAGKPKEFLLNEFKKLAKL